MILFRTNAGRGIGLGHLMRCLSLATYLEKHSPHRVLFAVNSEAGGMLRRRNFPFELCESFDQEDMEKIRSLEPELIVFDSYEASEEYLSSLLGFSRLALFDDNNDLYPGLPADLVINGNLHAPGLNYSPKDPRTRLLLGPEYLVMKPEYWGPREPGPRGKGLLITTGGADFHDLMPRFMDSLRSLAVPKAVVIGPAYSEEQVRAVESSANGDYELVRRPHSLKSSMEKTDVVITACASTVYEVLTLKRKPVIYEVADNQKPLSLLLRKRGIADLGWWDVIDWHRMIEVVEKVLTGSSHGLHELYRLLDGRGVMRVAEAIDQVMREDRR